MKIYTSKKYFEALKNFLTFIYYDIYQKYDANCWRTLLGCTD